MCARLWHQYRRHLSLSLKFGSIGCLFLLSMLIVACGGTAAPQALSAPQVTVTINLNQTFSSPTPTLPPYTCGAWATQSTPIYYPGATVEVYAKYVQQVNGNPQGMDHAAAHAIVFWPDGTSSQINQSTTADGLAVFSVPLQADAVGHVALVEVDFTSSDGTHTCSVTDNQRAFFTPVLALPSPTPTGGGSPFPFPSPTGSATPGQ